MVLNTVISAIIDLVLGKAGVSIKPDQRAELQARAMELARETEKDTIENLNKQADINALEASNGRLGWRNALCWGLTVAVLYQVFKVPILAALLVLCSASGVSYDELAEIGKLLPEGSNVDVVGMLMALAGLYGWRGVEKIQYAKLIK